METTILCKQIETLPTKNGKSTYIKITDAEGKYHNIMNGTPGHELIAQNKMLKLTKEQKGEFLNVVKIEDSVPPNNTIQQPEKRRDPVIMIDPKTRSTSLSYAKDLVVAGIIPLKDIYSAAMDFEKFQEGTFNPAYNPNWFVK